MRIAILSDVHSNLFALRAVLDEAAGLYDELLCLGDVVGYGAHPNECCELLEQRGAKCVLGNHDAAVLGWEIYDEWNPRAVESLDWTRDQLSVSGQRFLERSGEARLVEPGGDQPFWIAHGDLEEPFDINYILTVGDAFPDFERLLWATVCGLTGERSGLPDSQQRQAI